MSNTVSIQVYESTHLSSHIPLVRIIGASEKKPSGVTMFEIHAIVLSQSKPEVLQYRIAGAERVKELFPDDIPDSVWQLIPFEKAFAFVKTKAHEFIKETCDDVYERVHLYSIIEDDGWLQTTANPLAYSLSALPKEVLEIIYNKSIFGLLKSASSTALDISKELAECRNRQFSIDHRL